MTTLTPRAGLVLRYAYLWHREARAGREDATKDRPCAVLLALRCSDAETTVLVLPVTHSPPTTPETAIEIPAAVKSRLGLDHQRSWIVLTELNEFQWPGPDLVPAPGQDLSSAAYGDLPAALYRQVRDGWLALHDRSRVARVVRSE